jgi:phosphatidylinositol alpha-mannosyltransferase
VSVKRPTLQTSTHARASGDSDSKPRLRVTLVHPTNWPYVRRGTERFLNEFAAFLGARGHQTKIVCSKPGAREIVRNQNYVTDYYRSLSFPWLARFGILDYHIFPLTTLFATARERVDVIHCFNFTDALAASAVSRFHGAAVLLHLASIPPSVAYRRELSSGGALLRKAIFGVDQLLTVGLAQQQYFEERFGRKCALLPVPVDLDRFSLRETRDHAHPVILCASALEDRRKGGRLLMRAFNRVKAELPAVRLQISSDLSSQLQSELLGLVDPPWRGDVSFLGAGDLTDLPKLFGSAAVLAVPSLWEASSLALVEALATGTPIVSTTDRPGFHELIDPEVGRAFEPGDPDDAEPSNLEGLVEALMETLRLSERPDTARNCRRRAEKHAWLAVGPRYEALYYEILSRKKSGRSATEG